MIDDCPRAPVKIIPQYYKFRIIEEREVSTIKPFINRLAENCILILQNDKQSEKETLTNFCRKSFYISNTLTVKKRFLTLINSARKKLTAIRLYCQKK